MKTIDELRSLTRSVVLAIDCGGLDGIEAAVAPVRAALAARGLNPGCHVGLGRELTSGEGVEWYAGQLLDIVDTEAWFAMNSFINVVDRFCPGPTTGAT